MHPNWKAISTVYIKHQPFVTETVAQSNQHVETGTIPESRTATLDGDEISKFYKGIINSDSQKRECEKKVEIELKTDRRRNVIKRPTTFNQFCVAVTQNDGRLVDATCRDHPQMIDQTDQYNWTPLMMAACEGATDSFEILLRHNCDVNTTDKKGNSVYSLAKKRGHNHIISLLVKYFESNTIKEVDSDIAPVANVEFYCDLCKYNFKESSQKEHITSTLHQFNLEHHKFPIRFGIDEHNRGFQLMLKQGWNRESGLGREQCGTLFPVKTRIREFRTGLGVEQKTDERVTHFKPYDLAAIKRNNIPPKALTRRDLERHAKRDRYKERKIRNSLS